MSSDIPTVTAGGDTSQLIAALESCGAVIVEDFLSASVLAAFNEQLDRIQKAEESQQRSFANDDIAAFFGEQVGHIAGLAGKSSIFVDHVLCHPLYMQACDHFLKPNCADYQLNIAHVLERKPGCEPQFVHRDAWVWKRMPVAAGEIQLASIIALSDFTAENGGTLIVPGSHRWPEDRYPEPGEAVATAMSAGSAVLYLGNTFHGGGANITDGDIRRGIHVSYTLGWLRTEENQCLATPLAVARDLPERAQQLLGFGVHDDIGVGGGYLGTVELEAPHSLIARERM